MSDDIIEAIYGQIFDKTIYRLVCHIFSDPLDDDDIPFKMISIYYDHDLKIGTCVVIRFGPMIAVRSKWQPAIKLSMSDPELIIKIIAAIDSLPNQPQSIDSSFSRRHLK